ncbi:MAG: hypothetical protein ACO3JT_06100 [Candidatus Nanopelagicales bacterium]|jgi:hypothetical protein
MRRTVWVAIGATAGVIAYRRGQKLLEEARAKGVVGSVQAATISASAMAASARGLLGTVAGQPTNDASPAPSRSGASAPVRPTPSGVTGAAAARALAEARTSA